MPSRHSVFTLITRISVSWPFRPVDPAASPGLISAGARTIRPFYPCWVVLPLVTTVKSSTLKCRPAISCSVSYSLRHSTPMYILVNMLFGSPWLPRDYTVDGQVPVRSMQTTHRRRRVYRTPKLQPVRPETIYRTLPAHCDAARMRAFNHLRELPPPISCPNR